MDEEKKVNIDITISEIKIMLSKHVLTGSTTKDDVISDLILGHLALSEKGLSQLFKALLGVPPTLIYKEKDWVYIRLDILPSWRMDKAATSALPSVKEGYILAQITECNVYKGSPYKVVYDVIKDGETVATPDQTEMREDYIREKAEDFVDILDALEKLKEEKDAPF
jgi:hypothetical protein